MCMTIWLSVCYPEMGGQVGDTGFISAGAEIYPIVDSSFYNVCIIVKCINSMKTEFRMQVKRFFYHSKHQRTFHLEENGGL